MDGILVRLKKSPLEEYVKEHGAPKTSTLKAMQVCGVLYFSSVCLTATLTLFLYVYPVLYQDYPKEYSRMLIISYFISFNVWANYILTYTIKSFYQPELPTSIYDTSLDRCLDCSFIKPARAHHCVMCRHCILKRDHHCFFTGCCIGFRNQRYFIMFNFYTSLACFIAINHFINYLYMEFMPIWSLNFYHYILPVAVIEAFIGAMPLYIAGIIFVVYLTIMAGLGSGWFLMWQLFIVFRGQTTNEFWKGSKRYRTDILDSIHSVFGPYWLLNFIAPMVFLKPKHDGVHWGTAKNV